VITAPLVEGAECSTGCGAEHAPLPENRFGNVVLIASVQALNVKLNWPSCTKALKILNQFRLESPIRGLEINLVHEIRTSGQVMTTRVSASSRAIACANRAIPRRSPPASKRLSENPPTSPQYGAHRFQDRLSRQSRVEVPVTLTEPACDQKSNAVAIS
jgi:hypothetical protein